MDTDKSASVKFKSDRKIRLLDKIQACIVLPWKTDLSRIIGNT